MKEFLENAKNKLEVKTRTLITNANNVLEVLTVLNRCDRDSQAPKLRVFAKDDTKIDDKWIITFMVSQEQWRGIFAELDECGYEMVLTDESDRIFLRRY